MVFSCIRVDAKSVDSYDSYTKLVNPYKVNKNEEEFINVEFDDSFFYAKKKGKQWQKSLDIVHSLKQQKQ